MLRDQSLVNCFGDRLTLATFCLVPIINASLCGACTGEEEALELVRTKSPSLLFTTELLEQGNGIDLIRESQKKASPPKCLIFLRRETPELVEDALNAGATGVIFISHLGYQGRGDFVLALKAVLSGGIYVPTAVRDVLRGEEEEEIPQWVGEITVRELEVLQELAEGQSNVEIASSLNLSVPTVKTHLQSVYSKMGVNDRVKCLVAAVRAKIV